MKKKDILSNHMLLTNVMLKKLYGLFLGLSVLGLVLVVTGMIIDDLTFWLIADIMFISIFASSSIVFAYSMRKQ